MQSTLISTAELGDKLSSKSVIIDVRFYMDDIDRGRIEYLEGHIPGAIYAHLNNDLSGLIKPGITGRHPLPEPGSFLKKVRSWGIRKDDPVYIYDQGMGAYASRLWWMLNSLGHDKVSVLDGGFAKWVEEGRPVEKGGVGKKMEGDFEGLDSFTKKIERKDIESQNILLIDSRSPQRYSGIEEPIDPIAGHIPGAKNLFFKENLNEHGTWKNADELRKRFKEFADLQDQKDIVFYCGSGVTACHNILSMVHAGYEWPLLYPGSWSEYILDAGS